MDEKKACGLHCTKINNISVKFGNDVILKNVSIHIHCGELTVGLIMITLSYLFIIFHLLMDYSLSLKASKDGL